MARDLGAGSLPVQIVDSGQLTFEADDELHIEGAVKAANPVVVVLRIDDAQSTNYASRVNSERTLPPGPFRWTIAVKGLRTTDGRTLDYRQLKRMMVFLAAGEGSVTLNRFETAQALKLPAGTKGYALGAETAELPAGFERIAPGDPRVAGANIVAVHRPAPDPLVASGLRGIERLTLPCTNQQALVTIWTEDPGEWELLPHPLERRIRINGLAVVGERRTPDTWVQQRYLHGLGYEHGPQDDAWTAYGRLRGEVRSAEVTCGPEGVVIELAGSTAEALFLSAVLIEPAGSAPGLGQVEKLRADWYRSNWPVVTPARTQSPFELVTLRDNGAAPAGVTLQASAAPDSGAHLVVRVVSSVTIVNPNVALQQPSRENVKLTGMVWAGQMRLERQSAGDTVLTLGDNMLSNAPEGLPLKAGQPRKYEIWIDVPAATPPGVYNGGLLVGEIGRESLVPIEIEVLAVKLPPARKPAGFYLDEAPHLTWFEGMAADRDRQAACDMAFLARLGLNGSAPPLATPENVPGVFEADMKRAMEAGVAPGWLAYAPARRLLERHGVDGSAAIIGRVERDLRDAGITPPAWSVADEPSNPDQAQQQLHDWIAAIRAHAPGARIAGHLNTPKDRALVGAFDTVLLNNGYGLDPATLADAQARGADVWLYNTDRPRVSAGLWLWITSASRYVQWHARMPTGDPFDPIDGREGDVQAFLPGRTVCPAVPSIDRAMLEMADGVNDQRWLSWLSDANTKSARLLRGKLLSQMPSSWAAAAMLNTSGLDDIRKAIVDLARRPE